VNDERHLRAKLTFLSAAEGGWKRWPKLSGIRPHLRVKHEQTSCVVSATGGRETFESGIEYVVELRLLAWEHYRRDITVGMPIELFEGSKLVARGAVLEILAG